MLNHGFVRLLLPLMVFVSPALLRAQFQDPTPDELKMTADPAYPDAAAIYLNREAKTDDQLHSRTAPATSIP